MLREIRNAVRITTTRYDEELMRLAIAGEKDLKLAGVTFDGVVSATVSSAGVTDTSTVTDGAVVQAIVTYVRANFGSPDNYDKLKAAYDEQKAQLQTATAYTEEDDESGND